MGCEKLPGIFIKTTTNKVGPIKNPFLANQKRIYTKCCVKNVLYYFEKFVLIYKYTLLQLVADYKIWRLYYNIEYVLIIF